MTPIPFVFPEPATSGKQQPIHAAQCSKTGTAGQAGPRVVGGQDRLRAQPDPVVLVRSVLIRIVGDRIPDDGDDDAAADVAEVVAVPTEIGRASCRERV